MRAVAAADQKDMTHLSALDERNDLLRVREHGSVRKAGHEHMAAVDAAHAVVMLVAAERKRLLDKRRKVLASAGIRLNVAQTLIADHRCGVHTVPIARPLRHQAVRREQDGRRDVLELALLALPRRAEVTHKLWILFQSRIAVRRQHFAVRIDIDAPALGLLEQLRKIGQIMTRNHDERAFFDVGRHLCRLRRTEGAGVGTVEQLHAAEIHLSEFDDERKPFLHRMRPVDRTQSLIKPRAHLVVHVAEVHRVMRIRRHALHAEQQRRPQRDRIRVALPELHDLARRAAEAVAFCAHARGKFRDRTIVKIDVGQCGEQTVRQQPVGRRRALSGRCRRLRQTDQLAYQFVL